MYILALIRAWCPLVPTPPLVRLLNTYTPCVGLFLIHGLVLSSYLTSISLLLPSTLLHARSPLISLDLVRLAVLCLCIRYSCVCVLSVMTIFLSLQRVGCV